jgi:hypothetical protein
MISKFVLLRLREMDVLCERRTCFRYYLLDSRLLGLGVLSMLIV